MSLPESLMNGELYIVDAYNVIHSWTDLRLLARRSLDLAANRLIDRARALHDFGGVSMSFIFDGNGDEIVIEPVEDRDSLSRVFTPRGRSADAVIEAMVARAPHPSCITVVSRDGAIANSVSASGAAVISPEAFLERIGEVEQRQSAFLSAEARRNRPAWRNGLFDRD